MISNKSTTKISNIIIITIIIIKYGKIRYSRFTISNQVVNIFCQKSYSISKNYELRYVLICDACVYLMYEKDISANPLLEGLLFPLLNIEV